MNKVRPAGSRREKSDATRRRLIDATIEAIAEHGLANTTVATVARISGLSPGLIGFHFSSKNQLVRESLGHLIEEWRSGWRRIVENPGMVPHERVRAIIDREFSSAWFNQRTVAIWYGYWGGVPTEPMHREMCRDAERSQTLVLAEQFRLLIVEGQHRDIDADAAARGLSALMMGMYLSYGFDPEDFDRQSAKKICLSYLAGLFPKHFSQAWTRRPVVAASLTTRAVSRKAGRQPRPTMRTAAVAVAGSAVRWGVASDYGTLTDALVSPPPGALPMTGGPIAQPVFMHRSLREPETLLAEYERLCVALEGEGVVVHRIPPIAADPLACCVQDRGAVTEFGAVLCPQSGTGAKASTNFSHFYSNADVPVLGTVTAGTFLGANIVAIRPGTLLLACENDGGALAAAAQIADWLDRDGWEVGTILLPRPFKRADAMFRIVGDSDVLIAASLADSEIATWFEQHGFRLTPVVQKAEQHLSSLLSLDNRRVLIPSHARSLNEQLGMLGVTTVEIDLPAFACHGITLRQLVQPLHRKTERR